MVENGRRVHGIYIGALLLIGEGTNEMQRIIIAKQLIERSRA
jgi:alkylation response protein AidB-like acyl-CoA dehydrogenase